jgi:hypothetical protein
MCLAIFAMMLAPPPAFSQAPAPSGQTPNLTPPPTAPVAPAASAIAPSPPSPSPAPPPAPATPAHKPGFLEELGKLMKDSAESLTRVQSVTTGRTACPMTANGAPDCVVAAEQLCKGKGFKTGKSLDIETAEKCSAKVYLYGRTGAPGECRTENFVTRAICQ